MYLLKYNKNGNWNPVDQFFINLFTYNFKAGFVNIAFMKRNYAKSSIAQHPPFNNYAQNVSVP